MCSGEGITGGWAQGQSWRLPCNAEALAKAGQGKRRLQGWKGIQGQTLGREFGAGGDLREGRQGPQQNRAPGPAGCPVLYCLCFVLTVQPPTGTQAQEATVLPISVSPSFLIPHHTNKLRHDARGRLSTALASTTLRRRARSPGGTPQRPAPPRGRPTAQQVTHQDPGPGGGNIVR